MGNISLNLHMIKEGKKCISSQGNMVKQKEGSIVKQYEKNPYIIVCNVAVIIISIPVANDSVAYINNLIIITDGMVRWIACTMKKKRLKSVKLDIHYTFFTSSSLFLRTTESQYPEMVYMNMRNMSGTPKLFE